MLFKRVVFGSDHAGFALKNHLVEFAKNCQWDYQDVGTFAQELPVDYPDYARLVVEQVYQESTCGVLICGSGIGMSIAANRYPHIRAALCHEISSAQLARQHNNANIIVFGGRMIGEHIARSCLLEFLVTPFEQDRHTERLEKIEHVDPSVMNYPQETVA
eukprot:g8545.t1